MVSRPPCMCGAAGCSLKGAHSRLSTCEPACPSRVWFVWKVRYLPFPCPIDSTAGGEKTQRCCTDSCSAGPPRGVWQGGDWWRRPSTQRGGVADKRDRSQAPGVRLCITLSRWRRQSRAGVPVPGTGRCQRWAEACAWMALCMPVGAAMRWGGGGLESALQMAMAPCHPASPSQALTGPAVLAVAVRHCLPTSPPLVQRPRPCSCGQTQARVSLQRWCMSDGHLLPKRLVPGRRRLQ